MDKQGYILWMWEQGWSVAFIKLRLEQLDNQGAFFITQHGTRTHPL